MSKDSREATESAVGCDQAQRCCVANGAAERTIAAPKSAG